MNKANTHRNILPGKAIISITQRCNSRCSFCDIWRIDKPLELNVDTIDKLPDSLRNVDITGGEPLLHKDFDLIIEKLVKRNCRVIVNTNGSVRLDKYKHLWKMKNLGIRFSLDGIEARHDSLRGINGNYESIIRQIEYLKSTNFHNVGISSTFSDINIDQAPALYLLSRKLGIDFTCMAVGNSKIYYRKKDNVIQNKREFMDTIKWVIKKEMKTFNVKRWGKAIYMNELLEFIHGNIKGLMCPAGNEFFFMQSTGEIYACNMRNLFMGNLSEETFGKIWFSAKSNKIRDITHNCTKPCWTMCNAKSIMESNKLKYFGKFCRNFIRNGKK